MKKEILVLILATVLAISCKQEKISSGISFLIPEAGTSVKSGSEFTVDLQFGTNVIDSVIYLIDSTVIARKTDTSNVTVNTATMPMGNHLVTTRLFAGGNAEEISSNIVVLPAKAPELFGFEVVRTFPHDTASYTEGLEYHEGFLYESDGGRANESTGRSSLRKVDLQTGKILKLVDNDPAIFAEGISIVDDKIIQLTYTEKIGYVYDKNTFKLLETFKNDVGIEGWGLTFDGDKLYMDDGTNRLWFLDKDNYSAIGYVDVYDDKGPVSQINELEYIDGKIFANIYMSNDIVVIDPKTGVVLQRIDFSTLYPDRTKYNPSAEVFNGIAWDSAGKRLFVTGKKWDKLFQVKLVKK